MKYILIIYIISAGTSEQLPEWFDTYEGCKKAGMEVATPEIKFACVPQTY